MKLSNSATLDVFSIKAMYYYRNSKAMYANSKAMYATLDVFQKARNAMRCANSAAQCWADTSNVGVVESHIECGVDGEPTH